MTSALHERYAIGALHVLGKERLRALLDEHFGGRIPQPGTGAWVGFVFAIAPGSRPMPKLPRFPKALETADHFLPFDMLQPRNVEPFWVGFWSRPGAVESVPSC